MVFFRIILFIALLPSLSGYAQPQSPSVNQLLNRIMFGELDHFYSRLDFIEKFKQGKAVIVQIGDSHTQPDFISSVVREELQKQFGNGGRGLLFPYTLAGSNSPTDIKSKSSTKWKFNRVAHPELGTNSGVAGFIIYTEDSSGSFSISLDNKLSNDSSFIRLFWDKSMQTSHEIIINNDSVHPIRENTWITYPEAFKKINIDFANNDSVLAFYGLSVENNMSGLIYHNIGVNGARYDQYNISPGFWKGLSSLNADLFIVSLGTNEAQKDSFNLSAFQYELGLFVNKLREASPTASVLITTAMDSYKKQRPNQTLKQINDAIADYCLRETVALWDLYKITNGLGSARQWLRLGLMNKDKIHFLKGGYQLHGELLYKALIDGYYRYKQENIKTGDK
jgi:lysophospholipase L1-like esterase